MQMHPVSHLFPIRHATGFSSHWGATQRAEPLRSSNTRTNSLVTTVNLGRTSSLRKDAFRVQWHVTRERAMRLAEAGRAAVLSYAVV